MNWLVSDGRMLGVEWNVWKVIGWLGNAAFFARFFLQWYASEKQKRVVVPAAFWWLSLAGSLLLLIYALFYRHDSVFIFAYAFTWIPYIRNLMIHAKAGVVRPCPACQAAAHASAKFCSECGAPLPQTSLLATN